jgi:hypothetical protein
VTETDLRAKSARNNSNVIKLPTAAKRRVRQTMATDDLRIFRDDWCAEHKAICASFRERKARSLTLREDVPPFDRHNPAHLRAWESLWDYGQSALRTDPDGPPC